MIPTGTLQRHSTWVRTRRALALTLALLAGAGAARAGTVELISKVDPVPDSFGHVRSLPALSADGRYVAFQSEAPNLAPGQIDQNSFADIFFHDRVTGTTTLVSHEAGFPGRTSPEGPNGEVGISADGRFVVFTSGGKDLIPGEVGENRWFDIFLWDRVTDTTTLVSHAAGEPDTPADGSSFEGRISADGQWIAFKSEATNLVDGQIDDHQDSFPTDVFLYHRPSGTLTLVSHKNGAPKTAGDKQSFDIAINADGSFVAFASDATDLVPSDGNSSTDVFLYQRSTGTVSLVSRASGAPVRSASGTSAHPQISADGRFIAFESSGGNLIPGQVQASSPNVFLFDRVSGVMRLASRTSASPKTGGGGTLSLWGRAMSSDGRYLVFRSAATNLVPRQVDTNGGNDLFVYDRVTGTTALVSHSRTSTTTAATTALGPFGADRPSLSADGRFIAFESVATDLVPGQVDPVVNTPDIFLYDRSTQGVVLVSRTGGSARTVGNDFSHFPVVSSDGSVVVFQSFASDLGEGQIDPNSFDDLFLYRRTSAEVTLLSRRDPDLAPATPSGPSGIGDMSADGRFVVFASQASGLVPGLVDEPSGRDPFGEETGTWDVFLKDRSTGKITLVSRDSSSPGISGKGTSYRPVISADGRFIAFLSQGRKLVPGQTGDNYDLFLYDRISNTMALISHAHNSPTVGGDIHSSTRFAISADGRFVAYYSEARNLVAGVFGLVSRLYLYDRLSGTNILVAGGDNFYPVQISADGRFTVFSSTAPDLVPGQVDTENSSDVFLFDRIAATTTLLSHSAGSPLLSANNGSFNSTMSADGRFIVFASAATDLIPGQIDTEGTIDLFLYERESGRTVLLSHSAASPTTAANGESTFSDLSADGRFIVFVSSATDLVAGVTDTNGTFPGGFDVFLYDRIAGTSTLISHAYGAPATACDFWAGSSYISADGRWITFLSSATDLLPGLPPRGSVHLFLQDRATGIRTLVGRMYPNTFRGSNFLSFDPVISADGRFTAFTSNNGSLVAGDHNGTWDAFVYDHEGSGGTVPPCTLFDTRRPADGPALRSGDRKVVAVRGACGVPSTATAVVVEVTVPQPRRRGSLRLTPGNAVLRFQSGQTRTGTFTVPLAADGTLTLQPTVAGNGTVHAVIEVVGYQ